MAKSKDAWAEQQADRILLHLQHHFGKGWRRLVSFEVKRALITEQILLLLLAQATETLKQYKPAQELVQRMYREMADELDEHFDAQEEE